MGKIHKSNGRIKTTSKSLGLKSVLANDGDVIITTFGDKKNPTILEQKINNKTEDVTFVEPKNKQTFITKLDKKKGNVDLKSVKNPNAKLSVSNPFEQKKRIGEDYLGFKDKLETEMFGKTFDDNIHIQIAYNVLDLYKIIGIYVSSASHTLINIASQFVDKEGGKDLVGIIPFDKEFSKLEGWQQNANKKYFDLLNNYAYYFDNIFSKNDKDGAIENYDYLRIVSFLRQSIMHANTSADIFGLEGNQKFVKLANIARNKFNENLKEFNSKFSSQSKKNFAILFDLFNCRNQSDKNIIINEYYKFLLLKENRNLGINVRHIRQLIIDNDFKNNDRMDEKFLNSILSKLCNILDFVLFDYYGKNDGIVTALIEKLRVAKTDEEKEKIYQDEYKAIKNGKLYSTIQRTSHSIDKYLREKFCPFIDSKSLNIKSSFSISVFASFIYVLCKFLDSKEVNEITTTIINKFNNINSLVLVLKKCGNWSGFAPNYTLFNNYSFADLATQFVIVKNFSSVKRKLKKIQGNKKTDKVSSQLYCDAINILKNNNFVDLVEENGKYTNDYIKLFFSAKKNVFRDKRGKKIVKSAPNAWTKIRNFLVNTIINNRRFYYVIRHINPKECYKIIHNSAVIKFIFSENYMPLSQIERYYSAITNKKKTDREIMVNAIIKELTKVSFDSLVNFKNELLTLKGDDPFVLRQKQLISLYLTVIYLVVKGEVNTNNVYYLGWSCFDRDMHYKFDIETDEEKKVDYLLLTKTYKARMKPHVLKYINKNTEEAEKLNLQPKVYREYRNKIAHLNICAFFASYLDGIADVKSHFDIFNYVLQRYLARFMGYDELNACLDQYHVYNKDFVKLINLPFAYNLARYKNLTIANLFNDIYNSKPNKNNQ